MNRIVHFEIQAEDPKRAARFYKEVFDWEITEWTIPGVEIKDENRYWQVITGKETDPGINGGLIFRRGPKPGEGQPVNSFVCTVEVADLDQYVKRALEAGGSITIPKMTIKDVGWLAYCLDTENNIFGMMQSDIKAK